MIQNTGACKSYMHLKVKLLLIHHLAQQFWNLYKAQISEYEWRLNVAAENMTKQEERLMSVHNQLAPKAFSAQILDTSNKILFG